MNYEDFKIIRKIGRGAFGTIFLAKERKNGNYVSIKIYRENIDWDSLEEAAELSLTLKHPNLMICSTFFSDRIPSGKLKQSSVHLFTVLEYLPGISLFDIVHSDANKNYKVWFSQIISGLKYLHSHSIIHRDIKPQNIIIINDTVKIIDYDFLITSKKNKVRNKVGTPFFLSPEVFSRIPYNEKTDIWSLGVTIYYCLKSSYPFFSSDQTDLKSLILSNYQPDYTGISHNYIQILKGTFTRDFSERITLNQILNLL